MYRNSIVVLALFLVSVDGKELIFKSMYYPKCNLDVTDPKSCILHPDSLSYRRDLDILSDDYSTPYEEVYLSCKITSEKPDNHRNYHRRLCDGNGCLLCDNHNCELCFHKYCKDSPETCDKILHH